MIAFKECADCAAKSGAPALCVACLHNRTAIDRLRAALRAALDGWVSSSAGWQPGDQRKIGVLRKEFDS
jgi:hypothetical protein